MKEQDIKKLIDYLISESKDGHTEFRLVVREGDQSAYCHVSGRNSETVDFHLS